MSASHFIILLGLVVTANLYATDKNYVDDKDVQTLMHADFFMFGGPGGGPGISVGESAFRRILRKDDAINFIFPVLDNATLEGKCYALVALRLLSPAYFDIACKRLATFDESKVRTMEGCIVDHEKMSDLTLRIRSGRYDDEAFQSKKG